METKYKIVTSLWKSNFGDFVYGKAKIGDFWVGVRVYKPKSTPKNEEAAYLSMNMDDVAALFGGKAPAPQHSDYQGKDPGQEPSDDAWDVELF